MKLTKRRVVGLALMTPGAIGIVALIALMVRLTIAHPWSALGLLAIPAGAAFSIGLGIFQDSLERR